MSTMSNDLVDRWCQFMKASSLSSETIKLRRAHIRRLLAELDRPLGEINADHLIEWLAAHEWSPATRRSYRSSIVGFARWCIKHGFMVQGADEIPAARVPRSLPRPAADTSIETALRSADRRVSLMIELMCYGGLRRGEVARVKSEHLSGEWLTVVGKGGHTRLVPLPGHLCHRIREYDGYLFPGAIDGHLSARRVGELVRDALPHGVKPHQLRHRYATTVYKQSGDIRAVQTLLGHAKLDTTAIYVQVANDQQLAAAASAWKLAS